MSSPGILRIPMDLAGLAQFEKPGFEGVAVLGIRLGGEEYEIAVRKLPAKSHTLPDEPGRAATRQEIADLVLRLWIAFTANAGTPT